jgi:DTW domain-containing protein YfiP
MKLTKEIYLQQKENLQKKEVEKFQREDFCYSCFRLKKLCLCHHIVPFDPQIEIVLLIHPMEAKKEKMGTGRMTKAFLENSKLIMGVDFTLNKEVNDLIATKNCFVLYPGDEAINISTIASEELRSKKISKSEMVIFVIDGTWPCAKKMMKLSTNLHNLPRISFNVEKESMFDIKEQPSKFCLSTIESIHLLLSEFENKNFITLNQKHDQMLVAFRAMIDFQIQCAADPSLSSYRRQRSGFSKKSERTKSKKWEKRSILFKKA